MKLEGGPMLRPVAIADNVYWVGVNDKVKKLFEALWPIPSGISYNAYAVIGSDCVALIDTVDEAYTYEYLGKVKEVVGDLGKVRYLVINHLEPDHHGATPHILSMLNNAKIVTSQIGSKIIQSMYNVPKEKILVVNDGDRISLGDKTLRFIYTPWLHWPETMVTYLEENRILFSCDAFGSYGVLENGIFDDELDISFYLGEAKRYFSNIVAKYAKHVINGIEKLKNLDIEIVAPSHGPVYRTYISKIVELYVRWSKPEPDKNKVLVVYASMYGRGRTIANTVIDKLKNKKLNVVVHDASLVHPSYILSDVLDASTLILIYPSYDAGIFPSIENLLYLLQLKELGRNRYAGVINVFVWGSTIKHAVEVLQKAGFTILEPIIETKPLPDEKTMNKLDELINNIASKLIVLQP